MISVPESVPASKLGRGPFEVLISLVPNTDLPGDGFYAGSASVARKWVRVDSIADAARVASSHSRMGGSGNWAGGDIRRVGSKKVLARVSYNGRVWLPGASSVEVLSKTAKKRGSRAAVNPQSKGVAFADFKRRYFNGDPVSDKIAREFYSDFKYAFVGSLLKYKRETTSDAGGLRAALGRAAAKRGSRAAHEPQGVRPMTKPEILTIYRIRDYKRPNAPIVGWIKHTEGTGWNNGTRGHYVHIKGKGRVSPIGAFREIEPIGREYGGFVSAGREHTGKRAPVGNRAKRAVAPRPEDGYYFSVTSGDVPQTVRVTPDSPRLWTVVYQSTPLLATSHSRAVAVAAWRRYAGAKAGDLDAMPVWDGDLGKYVTFAEAKRKDDALSTKGSRAKRAAKPKPTEAQVMTAIAKANKLARSYNTQVGNALRKYGDHGGLISGVVRSHFPADVKDRLRGTVRAFQHAQDEVRELARQRQPRTPFWNTEWYGMMQGAGSYGAHGRAAKRCACPAPKGGRRK